MGRSGPMLAFRRLNWFKGVRLKINIGFHRLYNGHDTWQRLISSLFFHLSQETLTKINPVSVNSKILFNIQLLFIFTFSASANITSRRRNGLFQNVFTVTFVSVLQHISRSIEMPSKPFNGEINECPCCIGKASLQGINLFSTIAHTASNIESY